MKNDNYLLYAPYLHTRISKKIYELTKKPKIPKFQVLPLNPDEEDEEYIFDMKDLTRMVLAFEYQDLLKFPNDPEKRKNRACGNLLMIQNSFLGRFPRCSGVKKVKHYSGNDQYITTYKERVDHGAHPPFQVISTNLLR